MWGGPSQLETFDMKPDAPAEVRGEFNPISTKVPGIQICEHFTKLASMTDKLAIIRSLTHDDPAHLSSGHATLTGQLAPVLKSDADPPSAKDSPHLGALVSKLRPSTNGLPSFVAMPWKAFHPAAPGGEAPGQHGGWLGSAYDGMLLGGDLNDPNWHPQGLSLPADIGIGRLESRVELLKTLDAQRATLHRSLGASSYGNHQSRAMEMIGSGNVRSAFDLSQESDATRERYGRNVHGQCVLMARRLVEHGVPLVSVNWHNDGKNFWDTHGDNFNRLKNDLIPPADRALSALLADLEDRGLLDETIVAWVGEFGRKPQITANNAGREHWPFCYSGILAGGGIRPGMVYGSSDKHAAYPTSDPVSRHRISPPRSCMRWGCRRKPLCSIEKIDLTESLQGEFYMNYSCDIVRKVTGTSSIQPNGSHAKSNAHDLLSEPRVAVFVASRHCPDHHFGPTANL